MTYAHLLTQDEIWHTSGIIKSTASLDAAFKRHESFTSNSIVKSLIVDVKRIVKEHGKRCSLTRIKWVRYLQNLVNNYLDNTRDSSDDDNIIYDLIFKRDWEK